MSQVPVYSCEVCGVQQLDHSNWLLVTDQPRAHNLDILKWDDKLAAQPGVCHLCCTSHLHALVGAWIMPDIGIPPQADSVPEGPASLLSTFSLDHAGLSSSLNSDRESLMAMLDVVEVVLQGSKAEEEEAPQVFDA
jgi:hypothetical protein